MPLCAHGSGAEWLLADLENLPSSKALCNAVSFFFYCTTSKTKTLPSTQPLSSNSNMPSVASEVVSACMGGMFSASALYPLEILKTRMQAEGDAGKFALLLGEGLPQPEHIAHQIELVESCQQFVSYLTQSTSLRRSIT